MINSISKLCRVLAVTVFAVFSLGLSATVAQAETLTERAQGDGIRVAFYNFKPYAYKDDNDMLTGTDVETLRVVLERMGGKIAEAQATDWGALIPGVKSKRFDVVAAGMFVTPKRCAEVKFSEPTFGIQQAMVVPKGNPNGITNYESIAEKGLVIGVVSGAAQKGYADAAGVEEKNISQLPDNATGIAALNAGRIHAWAVSAPGVRQIIASVPEDTPIEATPAFSEVAGKQAVSHGAFAFRKDDAEFVAAFNAELTGFIGTPEHIALLEAHGMTADELPLQSTSELCGN